MPTPDHTRTSSDGPPLSAVRPLYVVIEGIDGTGKSTLARRLSDWLRRHGQAVESTAEPTSDGVYGRRIREVLADPAQAAAMDKLDLLALFEADRTEHMAKVVRPARALGKWIIQDRSSYSTAAYQGAQGIPVAEILRRNRAIAEEPDLVLLLDLPAEQSMERIAARSPLRQSFETIDNLRRVREIFLDFRDQPNVVVLDAAGGPDELLRRAIDVINGWRPA